MINQRILLFQDGAKLKAHPSRWVDIDRVTRELIAQIKHPAFESSTVDPLVCLENLSRSLRTKHFSCVIDLTSGLGQCLNLDAPIINNFHLSRLRAINSPGLDGGGFLVNLTTVELDQIKQAFDLSKPLILDDVSWSGRTILETVKAFSLDAHSVTAGLLVVNEGNFGESRTGAAQLLRERGLSLVAGEEVFPPEDDGFHLTDFCVPEPAEDIFDAFIQIKKLRETPMTYEHNKIEEINVAISQVLSKIETRVFPNALSSEEAQQLQNEGRLIATGGIRKNAHFDINPPNWLMPSFSIRVSATILAKNRDGIIDAVRELRSILNPGKEVHIEPKSEITFRRGVERF